MKNFSLCALAAGALLFAASCNKIESAPAPAPQDTQPCTVTFSVYDAATKATTTNDAKVNSLQVFVFLGDNLDVYGSSATSSVSLECTPGSRNIVVIANGPDLHTVTTKTALLATTSLMANSSVTSMEMVGTKTVTLSAANKTVSVPVSRLGARVVVSSIKKNFSSAALQALTFKVKRIYLVNVAGDCKYGGGSYTPTVWFNRMKHDAEQSAMTLDSPDATVSAGTKYSTVHTFYAWPNPTSADSEATTWSARHTRLVIEAQLGSDTFYYPITLPALESNKSYNIDEVSITRPGSSSPDVPVSFLDCSFSVTVTGWTNVALTEGTTI